MKAKKYRLETVLTLRSRTRDEAAQQVALRLHELQAAEDELARRRKKLQTCLEQLDKANAQMNAELEKGIQAREILAHQSFLNDLKKQEADWQRAVEEQTETVSKAEKLLAAAREKLNEAARELKSMETHRANWQSAREKEENRREQKISDEIGAILHGRREED